MYNLIVSNISNPRLDNCFLIKVVKISKSIAIKKVEMTINSILIKKPGKDEAISDNEDTTAIEIFEIFSPNYLTN